MIASAMADVIADQCGPCRYRAVDDLLAAAAPRLTGSQGLLMAGADPVAAVIDIVHRMDETVLPIQGPPGTGKTYVTARAILSLVRAGKRIGVASNSHEAISNVLTGCVDAIAREGSSVRPDIVHKVSSSDDGYPAVSPVRRVTDNDAAAKGGDIVGGTAFFFARQQNVQRFDWLFVDEAGQVGLANMAAVGRAARNLVLVGDPRQLSQVIQGAHPPPADRSCLAWLLGDHETVPKDRGIFLDMTRRMHPAVCRFISDQVYEGRLRSHPDTETQRFLDSGAAAAAKTGGERGGQGNVEGGAEGGALPEAGAFFVPVEHEGNAQVAREEVEAIRRCIDRLLAGHWTDGGGRRPMQPSDVIVVAPYNAQVNALRAALPSDVRVGTVDKFQGQEAPVCLVSMTASSIEDSAKGMDFLLSPNRINVAVSRAKGLALVFGSPRLRAARCETVAQMRLVNALCALETAGEG